MKAKLRKNIKLWSSTKTDGEFSKWIRLRDKRCVFCGSTEQLTNSHYWGRDASSTRYHPLNCDTLCLRCHTKHEGRKKSFYKQWKINQLGMEEYKTLERLYTTTMKRKEAIKQCMELLYGYPAD